MDMGKDKQARNDKDSSVTRSIHKRARQTAESGVKGVINRQPGAKPADMMPREVSDILKPVWDEVMSIFNRIVSGGRHVLAGMEPDPKTWEGKKVVDPKYSKVRGVDVKAKKIKLYNPWGANYPVDDLTIDEFVQYYHVVNINGK